MASAFAASSSPSPAFVSAAATLTSASARRNRRGMRCPEMGKLRTARCVDAPYRASAGTSISPMESRSIRVAGEPAGLSLLMPAMVVLSAPPRDGPDGPRGTGPLAVSRSVRAAFGRNGAAWVRR